MQVEVFVNSTGQNSFKEFTKVDGNGQRSVRYTVVVSLFIRLLARDSFQGQDAVSQELLKIWRSISRALLSIFLIIDRCMPSVSKDLVFDVFAIAAFSSSILSGSAKRPFSCSSHSDFLFDMFKEPFVVRLFGDVGRRKRLFQIVYKFRFSCKEVHQSCILLAQHLPSC